MNKKGMIKRIFFLAVIIAIIFLIQLVAAAIWNGSGTQADPYQITNCTQLQNMSANLTAYFKLMNDINCSNTSSWNAGLGFNPIGAAFSGDLSGQNYTVTNLYINRSATNIIGLFARLNGGNVSNLGLITVNISGSNSVGALVGYAYSTSIVDNVYSTGDIEGGWRVGGLIGKNKQSTVNNSNASVTVIGTNFVGGLVGYNYNSYIDNSFATGGVTGSSGGVGGLVGYNYGPNSGSATIDNSYATGNVSGNSDVGGLVGKNYGYNYGTASIDNSYATGSVTGSGNNVGGLAGYNYGQYYGTASIDNSYATGSVTGGGTYTGGLVGYNYGYNSGPATIDNSYATGNVSGNSDVGGLVGQNYASSSTARINNSFATGNVTGTANVGGLVGRNFDSVVNSYWYNNTGDGADNCIGNPAGACAGEGATISYFFNVSNSPLINWSYPPWDTFCNASGYPSLLWQSVSSLNNCLGYIAPDTTAPAWNPLPSNQVVNYSLLFSYDVNATDLTTVSYSVDNSNFTINASGYMANNTFLDIGTYNINISANDTSGNINSSTITVTVNLTCNTNITMNLTMNSDLNCAGTNGLIINAPITVDCANYTLTGTNGVGDGIYFKNVDNATVQNCNISGFNYAVRLWKAVNNSVNSNTLDGACEGIIMSLVNWTTISGNTFTNNGCGSASGITALTGEDNNNNMVNNDFTNNWGWGVSSTGNGWTWTVSSAIIVTTDIIRYNGQAPEFQGGGSIQLVNNSKIMLNGTTINIANTTITSLDFSTTNITANTSTEINATGVNLSITFFLAGNASGTVSTAETNGTGTTPAGMTLAKAVEIDVSDVISGNLTWALINIYYNETYVTDTLGLQESSLRIYYYNATSDSWQLEPNQGVDTTNDYVWANITHLSLFGAFGSAPSGGGTTGGGGGGGRKKYQCNDRIDNDNDELIDYPADPGCTGWQDNNEVDCYGDEDCKTGYGCKSNFCVLKTKEEAEEALKEEEKQEEKPAEEPTQPIEPVTDESIVKMKKTPWPIIILTILVIGSIIIAAYYNKKR